MKKITIITVVLIVFILGFAGCAENYTDSFNNITKLSENEANTTLASWMAKIRVKDDLDPAVDLDTNNKYIEELPEINSSFPLKVIGKNQVNIEFWASSEKAGDGNDGWVNVVAEKFNKANYKLSNGNTMSVSTRFIDAGAQVDYVTEGNMRPDAMSPANYLWGDMIASKGIYIETVESRLTGNTAGILMRKSAYDEYMTRHSTVNLNDLRSDAIQDIIMFGWTNPHTSDTALNMLAQMLISIDPENPLSPKAEAEFLELQKHVPPPAYTTAQMRESAKKGFVDVMTMECQAYSNEPTLKDFVFTPFGIRHDNPVFVFDNITAEKREVLMKFIEFAKNTENQALATQMGFNKHNDYVGTTSLSGVDLYNAQAIWKNNKSGGRSTVAVFVADVSGSMSGNRINSLKESLLNSMQYIGEDSEIGLISFSDDVYIELPIGKFQGIQRGKFQSAVKNLNIRGGTHIYSGAMVAIDMIQKYKENNTDANYMIFVLSDGANTGGVSEKVVSQLILSYGIPVHTIGYSRDADMMALQRLASYTEGFSVQVTEENVIYNLKNMFNSQM